jgi:hypothetical protein
VLELVDIAASNAAAFGREGSSPSRRTTGGYASSMSYRIEDSEGNVIAADLEHNDDSTQDQAVKLGGSVIDDETNEVVFDGVRPGSA